MSATCPHCGSVLSGAPAAIRAIVETLDMPRKERLAAETILACAPRWTSKAKLVERMYDDEGEDAAQPENVVQSHVSKLRRKLRVHGWTIEVRRHDGYRFALLADPANQNSRNVHADGSHLAAWFAAKSEPVEISANPAKKSGVATRSIPLAMRSPGTFNGGGPTATEPRASEHVEHSQA